MESNFKKGDKVFDILFGWGEVIEIEDGDFKYLLQVKFKEESVYYTLDGKYLEDAPRTLSFTEYTLNGFSQERLIDLPEIGELVMVSDNGNDWLLREVKEIQNGKVYTLSKAWNYFKRLR